MKIKSYKPNEINDCREASLISATILDELVSYISEGITTEEIDKYCLERIKKLVVNARKGGMGNRYGKEFDKAKNKAVVALDNMISYSKIGG